MQEQQGRWHTWASDKAVGLPRQSRIVMSKTRPVPAREDRASHCWNGGGRIDGIEASAQAPPATTDTVTGEPGTATPAMLTDTWIAAALVTALEDCGPAHQVSGSERKLKTTAFFQNRKNRVKEVPLMWTDNVPLLDRGQECVCRHRLPARRKDM